MGVSGTDPNSYGDLFLAGPSSGGSIQSIYLNPSGVSRFGDSNGGGDVEINGVLDVTQRRCYATLSSQGWYRVMNVNTNSTNSSKFAIATIVDINIGTAFLNNDNGTHKISLHGVFNNPAFVGEESRSNYMLIDKVRYTYDTSGNGHIDIHYIGTSENPVWCSFTVHTPYIYQHLFVADNFTGVATSPSNETELARYTFATITGMRVVHAQSSTSFGDAIAKIKDIIGDNGITYGGNAANNLHAGISGFSNGVVLVNSSGGPFFFATLGKYNANYYAAEIFGYGDPWRIRIRYVNGTYYAELYYPNY
jgi:hypothetical protein